MVNRVTMNGHVDKQYAKLHRKGKISSKYCEQIVLVCRCQAANQGRFENKLNQKEQQII